MIPPVEDVCAKLHEMDERTGTSNRTWDVRAAVVFLLQEPAALSFDPPTADGSANPGALREMFMLQGCGSRL